MGYNQRNDEIHDNIVWMQRAWEAERDALATVRRFNARLSSALRFAKFDVRAAMGMVAREYSPWRVTPRFEPCFDKRSMVVIAERKGLRAISWHRIQPF